MPEFRLTTFEGHINSEFQVMEAATVVCTLRLAEIRTRTQTPKQEAFSLFFLGPLDVFLPQGMHTLRHERLGELALFLVPVGKSDLGFQYEAVFNLLFESS
jgi:hypothetical protein